MTFGLSVQVKYGTALSALDFWTSSFSRKTW